MMVRAVLREMRVRQYSKNLLVFAAAMFTGNLLELDVLFRNVGAFLAFSLTASTVYVVNDIMDVEKDRLHPVKRLRPIASGALPVFVAEALALGFAGAALVLSLMLSPRFTAVLVIYFGMNIAYSVRLKHVVILDVMIIAAGFVLRAVAGVIVTGCGTTGWFLLCIFLLSLFLALAKRRSELSALSGGVTRRVLRFYSTEFLDQLLGAVTAMTVTAYALFALQAGDIAGGRGYVMLATVPLVIYGLFRYLYLMHMEGGGERPEEMLLHDRPILVICLLYAVCIISLRDL